MNPRRPSSVGAGVRDMCYMGILSGYGSLYALRACVAMQNIVLVPTGQLDQGLGRGEEVQVRGAKARQITILVFLLVILDIVGEDSFNREA